MVLGYFGKTPVPPDAEIVQLAAEQLKLEPTTADPRAINDKDPKKGIDAANQRLTDEGLPITEENTFIAATCGDKGIAFLKGNGPIGVRKNVPEAAPSPSHTQANAPSSYRIQMNGITYEVTLEGDEAIVNGERIAFDMSALESKGEVFSTERGCGRGSSDLPGKVLSIKVSEGSAVSEGDVLLIMEALKMEIEVTAPQSGTVSGIAVQAQQQVANGDLLITLR